MAECVKLFSVEGHKDRVWDLAFHPTQNIVASCSSDLNIKLWKISPTSTLELISTQKKPHAKTIRTVAWSSCGNYLASSSFDSKTLIWDYETNELEALTVLQGHESEVKSCAWSTDGSYIATCGRDKAVWVWSITEDMEFEIMSIMQEHKQDVKSVKWHPTRNLLVSTSYDNTLKIWDYEESCDDWICKQTLEGHTSTVWRADFSKDGDYLVSVGADGFVMLWKYTSSNYKLLDKLNIGSIQYNCAFHPANPSIITTVSFNFVIIY